MNFSDWLFWVAVPIIVAVVFVVVLVRRARSGQPLLGGMTRGARIALVVVIGLMIAGGIFLLVAPDSVRNWPSG